MVSAISTHACQLVSCVSEIYTLIVEAQGLAMFLINFLLFYRTTQGHGSSYKGSLIWLPSNTVVYSKNQGSCKDSMDYE